MILIHSLVLSMVHYSMDKFRILLNIILIIRVMFIVWFNDMGLFITSI